MKKRALRKIFLSLLVVIVSIVAVYLIVTGLNENFEKKDVGMSPETNVLAQSNYNQYQIRDISDANGNIFVTGWYSSPTINFGNGAFHTVCNIVGIHNDFTRYVPGCASHCLYQ